MKLSSDFVGTRLKDYTCTVNARWTMNCAASIDDPNPLYFDDERPGGIIAPPLFPVAVTWPIIEHIGDYIEAETFPKEVIFTQVHYTEHLRIHRPVRPGDTLLIKGSIAAILPHRAGTHVILRFDATDSEVKPVFTEHIGAMMRGVHCSDGGKGGDTVPALAGRPGSDRSLWESNIFIHPLSPYIYDGCTNIHFPIHTSVKFARQVGLPGIIHQGTRTLSLAVREIIDREAGGYSSSIDVISCRFTGMVLPGSAITVRLNKKKNSSEGINLNFSVINAEGRQAISDGHIQLKP
ncbi:MAG TPA: MaoC/PaaZ C-terminal domain-containing protein [Spirochaetota bacterium]|nr:MaoC/PaaZ C-terminal domain-containing protein [Spirochaetota bacterium]HQJ72625.1 MaoC/PaaZ C-terminal domain-containing protein [Spirochaetota bacterium]HRS75990.1 MaoC/PaaZ C-terminal domain-containing protein [Spirochaetota bacterium]HRT75119.1 MaoC/PaaZ C-terminal domain-containing protein [Spirochaetota bacterium]